jgi:hypothetical protein
VPHTASRTSSAPTWLLPLVGGLLACSHAPVRVDYVISGRVVDAQNAMPLEGVKINAHWPKAMPLDPKLPPLRQTFTDQDGRYVVFHPTQRDGTVAVGFIPTSVDEGDALGSAVTASCPNCRTVSVGIGKDTMDFLTRDSAGKVVVAGSVPRSTATVESATDGITVVQYELPDIPIDLQEPGGPPPIPPEAPAKPAPTAPAPPKAAPPDA